MSLSLNQLNFQNFFDYIGLFVIFISSLLCLIYTLILINPLFKKKYKRTKNLMYKNSFQNMTVSEYSHKIYSLDSKGIIENYASDILNLANLSLKFKSKHAKIPSVILITGLILGTSLLLIGI